MKKLNNNTVEIFLPTDFNINNLDVLNPDDDWNVLRAGGGWLLQTYLRLRRRGCPINITSMPTGGGIVLYHSKHERKLRGIISSIAESIYVCIRADRKKSYLADYEIVQNDFWDNKKNIRHIPYWPQPGLVPRASSRGNKIANISFKGNDDNLDSFYSSEIWMSWLKNNNIRWIKDSSPWEPSKDFIVSSNWNDYSNTDLIVAYRPPDNTKKFAYKYRNKPANKVINAWIAGVPIIVGDEYAYNSIRKCKYDFIKIEKASDSLGAIEELISNPSYYEKIVKNGIDRSKEYTFEKIENIWIDFLYDKIPRNTINKKSPFSISLKYRVRKIVANLKCEPKW